MKLYFGFGANRDPDMLRAITGQTCLHFPAAINGWQLCIEHLNDIPRKVQSTLRRAWGGNFVSYGIVKQPTGRVSGRLWLLTNAQRRAVRNWEFVGTWSHQVAVKAEIKILGLKFLVDAETEHLARQKVEPVDGLQYPTFLVPKEQIIMTANNVRSFTPR